jgi:hypothetical protein
MITCFPDPHHDELLFSVCARFDAAMIYPSKFTAVREMFGSTTASAAVDLPNRIDHLVGAILTPHCYIADGFIDDNTLFPFYAPFVPPARALAVRGEMRGSGNYHVYERLGITADRMKQPAGLKFCPGCVLEDRRSVGETYWHRVHQAPGVEVCPHHSVFLEVSEAPWRNSRSHSGLVPAERVVHEGPTRPVGPSVPTHVALLSLARGAEWLLKWRGKAPDGESLRNRYYSLLLRSGVAYYNGRIRSGELMEKFVRFYTAELLERLQCPVVDPDRNWILRLIRHSAAGVVQHPLRHLLLMTFLGRTPEEVFTVSDDFKPFGDGPWPCLNKASGHYLRPQVASCRIEDGCKKNLGKPVGTFSCECGFVYTRTGPDRTEEDRLKASSVQFYGHVWEKSLRALWEDASVTLREVADRLGVNELTVKRRAIQLGLTYPRNTPGSLRASGEVLDRYRITRKPLGEELEARRSEFLAVRDSNPEAGRQPLQEIAFSLLDWLRRHDAEWLEEHMPPVNKSLPPPVRVDWDDWDIRLAVEVEAAASAIRSSEGRPMRVSMTAIVNVVGHRAWFEKNLDRLPLTTEVVDKHLESHEDYLVRKVRWAENYYREQGIIPSRTKIEVRAGTRDRAGRTEKVEAAINASLGSLTGLRS